MNDNTNVFTEQEKLKVLARIGRDGGALPGSIDYLGSLLTDDSVRVKAKAMWLIGEAGLKCPAEAERYVPVIAGNLHSSEDILRERALNALGRIGRADFVIIKQHFDEIFHLSSDLQPNVRLAFIWACENLATNTPEAFETKMTVFAVLLNDENIRVRIEAPEIFRVIGKRKPEYALPFLGTLREKAKNDDNEVVRIHARGAIKAITQTRCKEYE